MKIIRTYSEGSAHLRVLGEWGCAGGKCPSLHITDDGRVIIQGLRLSDTEKALITVPEHEDTVAMSVATFQTLAAQMKV